MANTREIAYNMIQCIQDDTHPRGRRCRTMYRLLVRCLEENIEVFRQMLIGLDSSNASKNFIDCSNDIIEDGCNWGRVVVIFALGSWIACHLQETEPDSVSQFKREFTNYTSSQLQSWLQKQGGWNIFEEYFCKPEDFTTGERVTRALEIISSGALTLAQAIPTSTEAPAERSQERSQETIGKTLDVIAFGVGTLAALAISTLHS